jgi:sugar phosphate isomerase/epimerase
MTNQHSIGRRTLLKYFGASAGILFAPSFLKSSPSYPANPAFRYCLNTATIREHKLGLVKELELIAKAGYDGVEIWMDTLHQYISSGGKLADLRKRISDLGITVESAIGFAAWIVDDETQRREGIEQMKKEMDQLAAIGCKRTAAPPAGAIEQPGLDLRKAAERYRAICELGERSGVIPHLELWGFSANLNKLSEVLFVAIESGHPKAKVMLDNYHLYKGGTNPDALRFMNPSSTEIFHMNDYTDIPRATIKDEDRLMPGDGISPLKQTLKLLKSSERPLALSLEIFNQRYYAMKAEEVLKIGLEKMKKVTEGI